MRSLLFSSLAPLPALALAQPDASSFPSCLAGPQRKAQAQNISANSYKHLTNGLQTDLSVFDLLNAQPEFTTPPWDYPAGLVDEQRVNDSKAMLAQHDKLLDQVAVHYGIDKCTVVAAWGVESDYGRIFGKRPLLTSLSALSCCGRRQPFFQGEFLATLKPLQAGGIRDAGITGSWAGAPGYTQFMPPTHARITVDLDGDGRRDLIGNAPDAFGSTANYLEKAGWRMEQPWGYEAKVSADFPASLTGHGKRQLLSAWVVRGVKRANSQPLSGGDEKAAILPSTGAQGLTSLAYRNYDAIYSYNAAESCALAIALLSDHLCGGNGLVASWPTDNLDISRLEHKQLQKALLARGYDIDEADGLIGTNTRKAVQAEQEHLGLTPANGRAGREILEALKGAQP